MDQRLDVDSPRMMRRRGLGIVALAAVPAVFLGVFFVWPVTRDGAVRLTPAQLSMLCEGIDWRSPLRTDMEAPQRAG